MSAIFAVNLTAYGQEISGIKIPIGSTVEWTIACEDATTRLPIDLTSCAVVMSVCAMNLQQLPAQPPVIARQADINSPASAGIIVVPWADGDTVPSGTPLAAGLYYFDLWLTDLDGNRFALLVAGVLELVAAATLPATVVTPLPSQVPLALGIFHYAELPTAGVAYRGEIASIYGEPGFADTFWCCVKKADDTYEWAILATG
jgi:hypothetical protein